MRYLFILVALLFSMSAANAGPSAQGTANGHHNNDEGTTRGHCGGQGDEC